MSTITTVNPATGENIESFEMISAKDAAAKVEACHEAFSEWKLKSLEDRAAVIGGIGTGAAFFCDRLRGGIDAGQTRERQREKPVTARGGEAAARALNTVSEA